MCVLEGQGGMFSTGPSVYTAHHLGAAVSWLELEKPGFKKQDRQAVMMFLHEFSDKPLFSAQPEKLGNLLV